MPEYTVLATRGKNSYLLGTGETVNGMEQGVMLDTSVDPPLMYAPKSIASHVKWGYFEDFDGDPAPVLEAAARAQHVEDAVTTWNLPEHLLNPPGSDIYIVDREGNRLPMKNKPVTG